MKETFRLIAWFCIAVVTACGGQAAAAQAALAAAPTNSQNAGAASAVDAATRQKLQQRLDALALAYNTGRLEAGRKAMWSNHAVIRPNGDTLDREPLLAQWQKDWASMKNRKMTLKIASLEKQGNVVEATWVLDLSADTTDAEGALHKYRLAGTQQARYMLKGDQELLDGPIRFIDSKTTVDGAPWSPPG